MIVGAFIHNGCNSGHDAGERLRARALKDFRWFEVDVPLTIKYGYRDFLADLPNGEPLPIEKVYSMLEADSSNAPTKDFRGQSYLLLRNGYELTVYSVGLNGVDERGGGDDVQTTFEARWNGDLGE